MLNVSKKIIQGRKKAKLKTLKAAQVFLVLLQGSLVLEMLLRFRYVRTVAIMVPLSLMPVNMIKMILILFTASLSGDGTETDYQSASCHSQ